MRSLENHLAHLHSGPVDSLDVIHDIKHTTFQDVAVDQLGLFFSYFWLTSFLIVLGLVCTLLLRSDNNIIKYLEESVRGKQHKQTAKAREQLFVFIKELIAFTSKHHFKLDEYSLELLVSELAF